MSKSRSSFLGILIPQTVYLVLNSQIISVGFGNVINRNRGKGLLAVIVKNGISAFIDLRSEDFNALCVLVQSVPLLFPKGFSRRLFRIRHFSLDNLHIVFAVLRHIDIPVLHIGKNTVVNIGTLFRANFRICKSVYPCRDFRLPFRFGNVGDNGAILRNLVISPLVVCFDNSDLFGTFGGIDTRDFPVLTSDELTLDTVFLKCGFERGNIVFADRKTLNALRCFFEPVLHNLVCDLLNCSLVTFKKLNRPLFAVTDYSNRDFVLLCFCGNLLCVTGKEIACSGNRGVSLLCFNNKVFRRYSTQRPCISDFAADIVYSVNGLVIDLRQQLLSKRSKHFY